MSKTQEEIQKLKAGWMKDPCWDIEMTEGFEDHVDELRAFRKEQELEWQIEAEERAARRERVVEIGTGITGRMLSESLFTFEEIENDVAKAIRKTESDSDVIAAAQVRATLLLAAQVKRVAEALEDRNKSDEAESNLNFMTKLYKVE
jgi:hypothetical protein